MGGGARGGEVVILLSGALFHKSIYTKNWNGIMLIVHFFHLTFHLTILDSHVSIDIFNHILQATSQ